MPPTCPFCHTDIPTVATSPLAFAFRDCYPVSPGHTLIVTRRHVADFFACSPEEQAEILALVDVVKADLDRESQPHGYNVGFNAGAAAGQTVMHVHVHVIPRFAGDMEDPRGGVRHVIPDKANYLVERAEPLTDGAHGGNLFRALAPLLARATRIDILAAFVQDSGLTLIEPAVRDALSRGATLRILTGDYLDITQADALRRLLDWQQVALAENAGEDAFAVPGVLHARVLETSSLRGRAFHPKAWHVSGDDFGVAFVGSSNLSRSALIDGVEWNLRIDRQRDPAAWQRVAGSYERLWEAARALDAEWVAAYASGVAHGPRELPLGEVLPDAPLGVPTPTTLQAEALEALAASRAEGRQRALVVLATGLGKTVLAALDIAALAGDGPPPRVLWVAHRRELLEQAARTLRRTLPSARFGWIVGGARPAEPYEVLLASIQSLSRPALLHAFARDRFDVIVIDEVHHAEAASYRRILAHFTPSFLLGLTATPDRADGGDIAALFDDHVAYRADVGTGIGEGFLVPFRYFGLADTVTAEQYRPAWRNGRFDIEALSEAVETQARMEKLWEAWNSGDKQGARTMVFCVSVRHAVFARDWLAARGVRVRSCHGGPGADDRTIALQDLEAGRIDAICSVDLFNEGIDCRPLDRVVMLRPTESPVLYLQQLGRGLRTSPGKDHLVVIDFVGNHKVFLDRVRTLLSLGGGSPSLQGFVERGASTLPTGCTVDFELEAIDILKRLLPPTGGSTALTAVFLELLAARGERPLAGEMVRSGFTLGALPVGHGGWFGFCETHDALTSEESAVLNVAGAWLRELQTTPMSKCFKMVVLEVLLEADALFEGMSLAELATRAHAFLARSPELFEDLLGLREFPDPRHPDPQTWASYWKRNPVKAWCKGPWFRIEGEVLRPRLPRPEDEALSATLAAMTREMVDARLATYRRRRAPSGESFDAKVSWNQRDPLLFLPTKADRAALPSGDTDVRLPDGSAWRFRFAKVAVNVAHPVGRDRNELPDLLRRWFGPRAGQPGMDGRVRFRRTPDGWWVEPLGAVIELPTERSRVLAFPTLRAAAGWTGEGNVDPEAETVVLPGTFSGDQFAVRVAGDSMDGGVRPLRDGDWAIFAWARGQGLAALDGKVALVAFGDEDAGVELHIKRIVRDGGAWFLRSDNQAVEARPALGAVPYARFVRSVSVDDLTPPVGETVADLAARFGLSRAPTAPYDRVDGHLFLLAEGEGVLDAPDRWTLRVPSLRPGETAFLLARASVETAWTSLGVARWSEGAWQFEAPSREVWGRLSPGSRSSSRTLPTRWALAADALVERVLAEPSLTVTRGGVAGTVVGRSAQGGLRVSGGPNGFAERTVSRIDLGWALAAQDDVAREGGVLDEARVNRLRYLDGTEKSATRWIDTGWALAVVVWATTR
jgi:superfamily II DNA or RNA helicase/diadenosine tetraphosphate (Ap4A) HIT family hydrolase/HKD family nuclease